MQYTADNIVGIRFTCGNGTWTIVKVEDNIVHQISQSDTTDENSLSQAIEFLENGVWKVISTPAEQPLTYSIF